MPGAAEPEAKPLQGFQDPGSEAVLGWIRGSRAGPLQVPAVLAARRCPHPLGIPKGTFLREGYPPASASQWNPGFAQKLTPRSTNSADSRALGRVTAPPAAPIARLSCPDVGGAAPGSSPPPRAPLQSPRAPGRVPTPIILPPRTLCAGAAPAAVSGQGPRAALAGSGRGGARTGDIARPHSAATRTGRGLPAA